MQPMAEGLHPDSCPADTGRFHAPRCCNEIWLRQLPGARTGNPMKPLRLVATPTRNHRLNEILGLIMLVAAALLLLALASYTPSDPSFNTVGDAISPAASLANGPAHNWTGMVGAYFADAMLQLIGIAAFFLPLILVRIGVCWLRSRPSGSPMAKLIGLGLWVVFGPAGGALTPGNLR